MNLLKLLGATVLFVFLLTGCTAKYGTIIDYKEESKVAFISMDQDSTVLWLVNGGVVLKNNYKYSFGAAATTTINNGYTHFSILVPDELIKHYKERKVMTIEDAYEACESGENSFKWAITLNTKRKGCNSIIFQREEVTFYGNVSHSFTEYYIELHNEDRKDNITFNAKEVLESDLLRGLNKDYFVPNKR
ncbi:hypothetical protein [Aliarcobacter thereius]|uniref:Lipoprotein n=1 Tax=Aliarcobacter thereius LMG 24486 TaxID=1032240 RepID=A0A1C7WQ34_9BACT|nr:hypothetical protein [Aliarcobacter thereius]OCL95880.1 hypothetical protein AA347_01369 [Aliarcobacter thereius LMG 24486]QBF16147.1 hypothetical protein ATH_1081 [Aliarcobacter thereius LMG 24486]TLS94515.1 hypothetical protein FE244_00090 [Aliarcobacter thereius]